MTIASPDPYTIFIEFQLTWVISTKNPLKFGLENICCIIVTFNFIHMIRCASTSSNYMSQITIVKTLQ
jgi:hypothetical protein